MNLQLKARACEFADEDGVNKSFTDEGLLKTDILFHALF
jgi:hypothetical protein